VGVVGGTSEAAQPAPAPGVGRRPAAGPPAEIRSALRTIDQHINDYIAHARLGQPGENLTHSPETKSVRDQGSLGNESALRPARVVMRHIRQARQHVTVCGYECDLYYLLVLSI
jgi:hypothetical protein